jgi:predicted SAM-dependent methyltransferase
MEVLPLSIKTGVIVLTRTGEEMGQTLKRLLKRTIPKSLIAVFRKGYKELTISVKHTNGVMHSRIYRGQNNLKINCGCGPVIKKGWVNIDLCPGVDLTLDLREKFPFTDNSCAIVYSEHFFEHLDYPHEATFFLKESLRVLKHGGVFSVGVPDTVWPMTAYFNPDNTDYFKYAKEIFHPKWCVTRMEHINYHFRQEGEHLFAYDFETLKYILEKCGFREVKQRNFDPSLDSESRKLGTLYVDAIKPTF